MIFSGTMQWKLKQYSGIIEGVWGVGGGKFGGWVRGNRMSVTTKPSWGTWWVERVDIFQNKTMINIECKSLYQN